MSFHLREFLMKVTGRSLAKYLPVRTGARLGPQIELGTRQRPLIEDILAAEKTVFAKYEIEAPVAHRLGSRPQLLGTRQRRSVRRGLPRRHDTSIRRQNPDGGGARWVDFDLVQEWSEMSGYAGRR